MGIYNMGINGKGDAAMARARAAQEDGSAKLCLAALGVAMKAFGWGRYPGGAPGATQAIHLWKRWAELFECVRGRPRVVQVLTGVTDFPDGELLKDAISILFGDTHFAVNFGHHHRKRKNLPPWHKEALY